MLGLWVALHGLALTAVALEFTQGDGLRVSHLGPMMVWLLAVPLGAVAGWFRPLPVVKAAHELDLRAGLDDRISTALEFADDSSPMARLQRIDAVSVAEVQATPLFPVPWDRGWPWLVAALLLGLVCIGGALSFDLGTAPPCLLYTSDAADE